MSRRFALLLAALLLALSAPRSAPNTPLVVDASSSTHGQAGTSGRIGAPNGLQAGSGENTDDGDQSVYRLGAPLTMRDSQLQTDIPIVSFAQTHIGTAASTIRGVASYYSTGSPGIAAAGPNLRAALGRNWRGTWVRVSYRGRSAWLRLGDACWCRVADIDIPTRTFSYLSRGELWRGLLRVTITWGDVPRLPATSTEEGWKP